MPRGKPHVRKSIRLPEHQLEYVQQLRNLGIFGTKESDIVRTLIQRAIDQLNESRYIKNHFEDLDLLKNREQNSD